MRLVVRGFTTQVVHVLTAQGTPSYTASKANTHLRSAGKVGEVVVGGQHGLQQSCGSGSARGGGGALRVGQDVIPKHPVGGPARVQAHPTTIITTVVTSRDKHQSNGAQPHPDCR
jgi:hypothetical protein